MPLFAAAAPWFVAEPHALRPEQPEQHAEVAHRAPERRQKRRPRLRPRPERRTCSGLLEARGPDELLPEPEQLEKPLLRLLAQPRLGSLKLARPRDLQVPQPRVQLARLTEPLSRQPARQRGPEHVEGLVYLPPREVSFALGHVWPRRQLLAQERRQLPHQPPLRPR